MQSFNTNDLDGDSPARKRVLQTLGPVERVPPGSSITVALAGNVEIAVWNVDGEFYAIDNFCPHQGAPLANGFLCGHIVECELHGWQFDVRSGECLTVSERITCYRVIVEDGILTLELPEDTVQDNALSITDS
jgi:nitrite reductase/ring-hydroxylating ferredoxin subunit